MKRWWVGAVLAGLWPASAGAHEFAIYFQPNSTEVRGRFRQVVMETACYARLSNARRVIVEARTDTVGPALDNLRLSARRAEAVATLLVEAGVDPRTLQIRATGETQPAVVTADDVAEPVNRLAVVDMVLGDAEPGPTPPECVAVIENLRRSRGLPTAAPASR